MDRFSQKIGALPVWAWALLLGVGIVAVMYWMRLRNAPLQATAAPSGNGALPDLLGEGGGLSPSASGSGGGSGTGDPISEFVSNLTWLTQGVALLSGQGVSPLAAQQALEHYVNGETLTEAEAELVNRVITAKGLPPQGTAATPNVITNADIDAARKAAEAEAARLEAERVAALTPTVVTQTVEVPGPVQTVVQADPQAVQYMANFSRADYWYGAQADAARVWLVAHGYTVPEPTPRAQRLHYLREHDDMRAAYARGNTAFRTWIDNHTIAKSWWFGHGGSYSTSEFANYF